MSAEKVPRGLAEDLIREFRERLGQEVRELPDRVPVEPADTFADRWDLEVDRLVDGLLAEFARRLAEISVEGSA